MGFAFYIPNSNFLRQLLDLIPNSQGCYIIVGTSRVPQHERQIYPEFCNQKIDSEANLISTYGGSMSCGLVLVLICSAGYHS